MSATAFARATVAMAVWGAAIKAHPGGAALTATWQQQAIALQLENPAMVPATLLLFIDCPSSWNGRQLRDWLQHPHRQQLIQQLQGEAA
jgi:hypothetical protein